MTSASVRKGQDRERVRDSSQSDDETLINSTLLRSSGDEDTTSKPTRLRSAGIDLLSDETETEASLKDMEISSSLSLSPPSSLLKANEIESLAHFDEEQRAWEEKEKINRSQISDTMPSTISNVDLSPPDCIRDESDLGYVNGILSFEATFYNCLKNIADASSLPTLINGSAQAVMYVGTNIILNNLHKVSIDV